ncbi:MAG: universal stress protein [Gammaproteobacteria bacterium]
MYQYKHLLIASDLTPESVEVCRQAKHLADTLQAKLSIVHVVEPPPLLYGGGEFVIPMDVDIEASLADDAKTSLNQQSQFIGIPKSEQWVVIGNLREEIVQIVHEHAIDLIVVGGHDRHGLSLLLPSTTDTLVHALPCDIWVIKIEDNKK